VSLSPAEGNPGDSITVQIRDFDVANGTAVTAVVIRGADDVACGMREGYNNVGRPMACGATIQNGDADVTIEIPNTTPGEKRLDVYAGGMDEDTLILIGGSSVIASPTTVIPNQRVTLTGSSFSSNSEIDKISLGGDQVDLSEITADDRETDSGGSWTLSINIPVTESTSDGGSLVLLVEDEMGRTGSTVLTVPEPTVTFTPEEGLVGSTVMITGQNFPGLNDADRARDIDIDVEYLIGSQVEEDDSVEPDVNGRWQTTLEVPNEASIPSTNVVRVVWKVYEDQDDRTGTDEIRTFRHRVPPAVISINPASGPEGSMVTLTGSGFNRFQSLENDGLEVGSIGIGVSPNPSTDRVGNVSFRFQIPGIDNGIQNVSVTFGRTTAIVGFNVTDETGVVGAETVAIETALAPLLEAGTLDRVFYFNNSTKQWQWHIVDPAFAASNNLNQVVSGAPLWVLVTMDTTVVLNNRTISFTCADGDCWNLITFP
jgi:hypothetical protein